MLYNRGIITALPNYEIFIPAIFFITFLGRLFAGELASWLVAVVEHHRVESTFTAGEDFAALAEQAGLDTGAAAK